jgi:hypothetical protein
MMAAMLDCWSFEILGDTTLFDPGFDKLRRFRAEAVLRRRITKSGVGAERESAGEDVDATPRSSTHLFSCKTL